MTYSKLYASSFLSSSSHQLSVASSCWSSNLSNNPSIYFLLASFFFLSLFWQDARAHSKGVWQSSCSGCRCNLLRLAMKTEEVKYCRNWDEKGWEVKRANGLRGLVGWSAGHPAVVLCLAKNPTSSSCHTCVITAAQTHTHRGNKWVVYGNVVKKNNSKTL